VLTDPSRNATQVEAVDCALSHNRAADATCALGGAVYVHGSTLRLRHCELRNNTADSLASQGGAVFAGGMGAVSTENCTLEGNRALGVAGDDSTGGQGGSAYLTDDVMGLFNSTVFADNIAGGGGALVATGRSRSLVSQCELRNNTVQSHTAAMGRAAGAGGALLVLENARLECTHTTFVANHARTVVQPGASITALATGGAVAVRGAEVEAAAAAQSVVFVSSRFINNTAMRGGALAVERMTTAVTLQGCVLHGNVAAQQRQASSASSGLGGAVFAERANITVNASDWTLNRAESQGGAMYLDGGILQAHGSTFAGNSATRQGGAAYMRSPTVALHSGVRLELHGCSFFGNRGVAGRQDDAAVVYIMGAAVSAHGSIQIFQHDAPGMEVDCSLAEDLALMDGLAINLGQMVHLEGCTAQPPTANGSLAALLTAPSLQLRQRCRPTTAAACTQPPCPAGVGVMGGSPGTFSDAVTDKRVFTGMAVVNDYTATVGLLYNCSHAITVSDFDAGNDVYIRSAQASAWKLPSLRLHFAGNQQQCVAARVPSHADAVGCLCPDVSAPAGTHSTVTHLEIGRGALCLHAGGRMMRACDADAERRAARTGPRRSVVRTS
jgi:hypothetical protein